MTSQAEGVRPSESCSTEPEVPSAWVVMEGACIGALGGLWLTGQNLFDVAVDDRIGGVSVPAIHRFLATDYRSEVVRAVVELLALSLVVGALTGAVAAAALFTRGQGLGRIRQTWWMRQLSILGVGATLLGFVYLYDVAARPALHQGVLFERGGVRAWLQIAISDGLGRAGVVGVGLLVAGLYCLWPLRPLKSIRNRLRRMAVPGSVLFVIGIIIATAPLESCSRAVPSTSEGPINVLVLAADSLRPDRLDSRRAPAMAK